MVAPPTNQLIAERVRAAMAAADRSEAALADNTGIPRTTLRRRLTGKTDWMTGELTLVSADLEVAFSDLLAEAVA